MDEIKLLDWINIFAAVIAIILGIVSLVISVVFYFAAKQSETRTSENVVKIEQSVDALKTIVDGLLNRLIAHLTSSHDQLISSITQYERNIRGVTVSSANSTAESVRDPEGDASHAAPATVVTSEVTATQKVVRDRILGEIRYLNETVGRADAYKLSAKLNEVFNFTTVFDELMRMQQEGVLTWESAPKPPEAKDDIEIVHDPNAQV